MYNPSEYDNKNVDANAYDKGGTVSQTRAETTFLNRVYLWMFAGLMLTAGSAYMLYHTPAFMTFIQKEYAYMVIMLIQIGLVLALTFLLNKINAIIAGVLFAVYAASLGCTFSLVALVYPADVISSTFLATALTFGVTSVIGYVIKADLRSMHGILLMALVGLIIATVVNIFWANETLQWIITYVGVLLFIGLTIFDTNRAKFLGKELGDEGVNSEIGHRFAIITALALYLDFINLFLFLLRIFAANRD